MFEADGQKTFVTFDTLTIDLNPLRYLSSELEIEKIRLVKPEVTIIRNDSVFNFDDIIAFFYSKPKGDTVSEPSKPFKYVLKNLSLVHGNLTFTDKGVNYTNIMKDLGFTVPYISYNQEEISQAGLKFYFENGGFLQAQADYNQKKGAYNADFTISQLDLSPFLPFTKDYVRFESVQGIADGKFHLGGNINKLDSIAIRGNGDVTDFAVKDLSGRKVLGAKSGKVTMDDTYPMKFAFNFDTIALTEPYLFY